MKLLGQFFAKMILEIKISTKIAIILTPFGLLIDGVNDWFSINYVYVSWVLSAILVDWVFGIWKHLKFRTFSLKLNAIGLFIKLSMCLGVGFLFEGFNHLTGESEFLVSTLKMVFRLVVFIYPTFSALKSMSKISNGKMPPEAIMNMFTKFNENLDLNNFNPKKDESNKDAAND